MISKKQITFYLLTGCAFLLVTVVANLITYQSTFWERTANNIWLIVYLVVNNFLLFEYTVPSIQLNRKRILIASALLPVHLLLFSFVFFYWRELGISLGTYFNLTPQPSLWKGVEYHFGYSVVSILFFGAIRHIVKYRQLLSDAQKLRIEKQEAELNFLKSQTNPHFLFNTLNNIYSLIREKPDLAEESVLRLSDILRFILYETNGGWIRLEQELKIIKEYIELEKLRYDDSLHVTLIYEVENDKQLLPPLLLIPLVENAFKHGVSESIENPFIEVSLSVHHQELKFTVRNSINDPGEQTGIVERIGLSNIRRQLELLYRDFNISTQRIQSTFVAELYINLASYVKDPLHNN